MRRTAAGSPARSGPKAPTRTRPTTCAAASVAFAGRWGTPRRLLTPSPRTLRLDVEDAHVDVIAFDAALAAGDAAWLETAISLCPGPLLEGCAEDWAASEHVARDDSCVAALEALAARATARRQPDAAIGFLRRAASIDPLRESTRRRLMEALAAAGEYTGAKQAYRDLRLLHREVNAEPDPETVSLFEEIRERAKRRRPRERSSPGGPASPTAELLTSLVGREAELRVIAGHLHTARLLTLAGEGGVGKTRLAVRAAEEQGFRATPSSSSGSSTSRRWPMGPHFRGSSPRSSGSAKRPSARPWTRCCASCAAAPSCWCWITASTCWTRARGWRRRCCAAARRSASSRPASGTRRARRSAVARAPLEFPVERAAGLRRDLPDYSAVRLFVERARLVRPDLPSGSRDLEQVAKVCRQVDGIPLAIELAAAQLRSLTIGDLAARLTGRASPGLALAAEGPSTAVPRHRTLRGTLEWSWGLLTDEQQVLLRRLSVFTAASRSRQPRRCTARPRSEPTHPPGGRFAGGF